MFGWQPPLEKEVGLVVRLVDIAKSLFQLTLIVETKHGRLMELLQIA